MSESFGDKQAGRDDDRSTEVNASNPIGEENLEASWQEVDAVFSDASPPAATESAPPPEPATGNSPRSRQFDPSTPLVMVETAFLASAASVIWLVNFYFPMGPLLRIFFPIPIALTYLRWGSRAAWMGALVSGLLLTVLMGPARSVLFVMPFGLMGVMLGMFWQRRAAWSLSIFAGSLLGAFGFFFRIWLVSLQLGDDLWLYATAQVTDLLDWILVRLGLLVQPTLLQVQAALVLMIWLNNFVYLFVVHLVAWFLLDRLGNSIPRPPKWVQVLMDYE